jgi:hypothetical protein
VIANAPRKQRSDKTPIAQFAPPPTPVDIVRNAFRCTLRFNGGFGVTDNSTIGFNAEDLNLVHNRTSEVIRQGEPQFVTIPGVIKLPPPDSGTYSVSATPHSQSGCDFIVTQPAKVHQIDPKRHPISARIDKHRDYLQIGEKMQIEFQWSTRELVFFCQISDGSHEQPHTGADLWKGDCVQLAVDPMRDAVRGSKYDRNDSEFAIALTDTGPVIWRYRCPVNSYGGAMPTEWVNVARKGNETCYAARIPWIEIGVENPRPGRIIGVAVAGCDWHSGKRTVHRFGDGIIGGKEPYRFASIQLVGSK